jgi:L-threonylcarbamoyladenylate synthase
MSPESLRKKIRKMKNNLENCGKLLKEGKIGIIPTDTIYGISASVFFPETVEKVYAISNRNPGKPFIILISSLDELKTLEINITDEKMKELKNLWPGKISVIFPCLSEKLRYLHRGKGTLAVRLPKKEELASLLKFTGPLISTSANPEGKKPAKNIQEAEKYFGDKVDFYVDEGDLPGEPSILVDFTGDEMKKLERNKK